MRPLDGRSSTLSQLAVFDFIPAYSEISAGLRPGTNATSTSLVCIVCQVWMIIALWKKNYIGNCEAILKCIE